MRVMVQCAYCTRVIELDSECPCLFERAKVESVTRPNAAVRTFETGGTRSDDADRYDPEGALSPLVIERFAEYMRKHTVQADGSVRTSDNWQKGMPTASYMKGLWRHMLHAWSRHRGVPVLDPKAAESLEEDLCAILFNVQGYLHELLMKPDHLNSFNRGDTRR